MENENEKTTTITIENLDGAIVFRETGVEVLLPSLKADEAMPDHLMPLVILVLKMNDKKFMQDEINTLFKKLDEKIAAEQQGN